MQGTVRLETEWRTPMVKYATGKLKNNPCAQMLDDLQRDPYGREAKMPDTKKRDVFQSAVFELAMFAMDSSHGVPVLDEAKATEILRRYFGEDRAKLEKAEAELKRANGVLDDLHRGG